VVSLIVVSMSLAEERRSRREADAASLKSQQFAKFLQEMLNGIGPSVARGRDTSIIREILDTTATNVGKELDNQPAVEADIRTLLANLYEQIGQYAQAEDMARAALAIRRKQFTADSPEVASLLHTLAGELTAQHKYSEAAQVESEALAIRRRLYGDENEDTASSLNNLSSVYRDQRKLPEAEAMAREALRIRRKLFTNDNSDIADSLRNLCLIKGYENDWTNAVAIGREMLGVQERLLGTNDPTVAGALADVAWAANGAHQFAEAEALQSQALAIRQKYLAPEHPDMGKTLNSLGKLMAVRNDLPEAHAVLQAVLSIQRKSLGPDDPATLDTVASLASVLESEGKQPEAEALRREALAGWRKHGDDGTPDLLYAIRSLGLTLEAESKWSEAETLWRESLDAWRKSEGIEGQQSMYTLRKLGLAFEMQSKWPDAEAVYRQALTLSQKKGNQDSEALVDRERVARMLVAEKKFGEAERLLDDVLTPAFVTQPASANLLVRRLDLRGRQGRWPEAEADATLAVDLQPTDHYRYHTLVALLAESRNRPAYEQLCRSLLTKFANPSNPYVAERVAQDCLLLPHSGEDLEFLDKQADLALALGGGYGDLPYFQACKAMANYRLGRFAVAINWGERAVKSSIPYARAKAYAVLALAHWQLGEKDAARAMLAKGDALAPNIQPASQAVDLGDSWVAWLMARISLDEAGSLIQPGAAAGPDSIQPK